MRTMILYLQARMILLLAGLLVGVILTGCKSIKTQVPVEVYDFSADRPVKVIGSTASNTASTASFKPLLTPAIQKPKHEKLPPRTATLKSVPVYSWPKGQRLKPGATNRALMIHDLGKAAQLKEKPKIMVKQDTKASKKTNAPSAVANHNNLLFSWPGHGKLLRKHDQKGKKGIELAGKVGDPVFAAADGQVTYTGTGLRGYGKLIVIKHAKGFLSVYAHNSKILVKESQRVKRNQKIAELGDTEANSPKLLFQLRQGKRTLNPEKYLPKK